LGEGWGEGEPMPHPTEFLNLELVFLSIVPEHQFFGLIRSIINIVTKAVENLS
jgi:hypothetical protein